MNRKKLFCLLLLPALLCLFLLPAAATQAPDLSRTGSIRLTMRYEGNPVGGGELTLYQVAAVREDNGYSFAPVAGLEDLSFTAASLESPEFAATVLARAKEAGPAAQSKTINSSGEVRFDGLPLGLYLIEQTVGAPGFSAIRPFFVSIPMTENGELIYDVDASPKPEPMQPEPTGPTEPTNPTEPTAPTVPDETLPQTGQLNWPIPPLTVTGLLCLLAGLLVLLRARKERK